MKKIIIKTSTAIDAAETTAIQQQLEGAASTASAGLNLITYEIVHDTTAPSLDAYGQVGATVITPSGSQKYCYALYAAAIAAGVPQDVAYAAYLVCLAT